MSFTLPPLLSRVAALALLALVLIDHALMHRAQCGDVKVATPRLT